MLSIRSALVLAVALLSAATPAAAVQIVGQARVIDGDTIEVAGQTIRLAVVDTPEAGQSCDVNGKPVACGAAASFRLENMLAGREVRCDHRGAISHGRAVADCHVDGTSVTLTLLAEGIGKIDSRYLHEWPDRAAGWERAQDNAAAARLGLWQGHAMAPRVYRTASGDVPQPGCAIKGNINDKGSRIYHMPGQRYYDRTRINKPGEHFFCSEAEAQAAGFRRAKV